MKLSKTLKAEEQQKESCHRPADRNNPKPYKPQRQNRGIAKTNPCHRPAEGSYENMESTHRIQNNSMISKKSWKNYIHRLLFNDFLVVQTKKLL